MQLTATVGPRGDRVDMLLQPWDLLDLVPRIARLKERAFGDGILLMPGNNLGYFGPEEALLRSPMKGGRDHFQGCTAGRWVLGIESDGVVKGCPSLQTASYRGGNVREEPLATIWNNAPNLAFARTRSRDSLWGFCASCPFAEPCMGAAPSPRTRSSEGLATILIAIIEHGRSRARASGSASSGQKLPPANRSTTDDSTS